MRSTDQNGTSLGVFGNVEGAFKIVMESTAEECEWHSVVGPQMPRKWQSHTTRATAPVHLTLPSSPSQINAPIPFSPKSSQARPCLGSPRSGAHYRDQRVDHLSRRTRSVVAATPGRCLPPAASAQDRNQGQSVQGSMLSSPPTPYGVSPLLQPPLSQQMGEKLSAGPASTLGLQ